MKRKKNGQGQVDRFYLKVQKEMLEKLIADPTSRLLVVPFDPDLLFCVCNRGVFYLVPKSKFYLDRRFITTCVDAFRTQVVYVTEFYLKEPLKPCVKTGVSKMVQFSEIDDVLFEVTQGTQTTYVSQMQLSVFPKNSEMFYSESGGPVYLKSSLGILVGGVFPISV